MVFIEVVLYVYRMDRQTDCLKMQISVYTFLVQTYLYCFTISVFTALPSLHI